MGWIGSVIGGFCGGRCGGILGALAGAVLGNLAENWLKSNARAAETPRRTAGSGTGQSRSRSSLEREVVFLTAIGAMFAKLSKADGRVVQTEIDAGERAFQRLGLSPEKREFCIRAFRTAKCDGHSIFEYAEAFAGVEPDVDMRELVYDILWEIACADGILSPEEETILERIVLSLHVRPSLFQQEYRARIRTEHSNRRQSDPPPRSREPDPYELLGCPRSASDAEVRRAYREKAKKFHPDILRAKGLPEEMLARANEQMARINAAWDQIKRERGLS